MNGWMIIFALTSMTSGVWSDFFQDSAALFACLLFAALFVLSLCAKAVRGAVC